MKNPCHARPMLLSIIIPAWNEEKLLPATLTAIRAAAAASLTPAGVAWELIVCDNNSTDRTAAVAREAGAAVVFEPINQIGRARNAGAAAATGDWILFVDADSTPSPALFADLATALQDPQILGGGSLLHMPLDTRGARAALGIWHFISTRCRYAAGSFLFVRTPAFRESGGFDPAFFAGEELFLSKKLKALAQRDRQEFVILTKNPMPTSPRKLQMHHPWQHLAWMLKTILTGGRTLKRRESCGIWYDGQR
jgi:glycosyltransferase involved in cell wall biosynthesis